ncbi:MAG: type II toxin-antitoxin system RelE/ParE family toxin [Planctomycetota bacterium]
MTYELIIEPEAEFDLEQAVNWYNAQRTGLGLEFLACVAQVFDRIRVMPEIHPVIHSTARLALVGRFPYVVCYDFHGDSIYVIAVFHGHRDPNVWQDRLP